LLLFLLPFRLLLALFWELRNLFAVVVNAAVVFRVLFHHLLLSFSFFVFICWSPFVLEGSIALHTYGKLFFTIAAVFSFVQGMCCGFFFFMFFAFFFLLLSCCYRFLYSPSLFFFDLLLFMIKLQFFLDLKLLRNIACNLLDRNATSWV